MTWLNDAAKEIEARDHGCICLRGPGTNPACQAHTSDQDTASFKDWGHLDLNDQP